MISDDKNFIMFDLSFFFHADLNQSFSFTRILSSSRMNKFLINDCLQIMQTFLFNIN